MHSGGSCVVCHCHSCLVLLDSMRCVKSSLPINRCLGILNVLGETIMLKHQLSQPHILTEAEASSNLKTSFYKDPPIHISYLTAPLLRIDCTRRDAGAGAGMEKSRARCALACSSAAWWGPEGQCSPLTLLPSTREKAKAKLLAICHCQPKALSF